MLTLWCDAGVDVFSQATGVAALGCFRAVPLRLKSRRKAGEKECMDWLRRAGRAWVGSNRTPTTWRSWVMERCREGAAEAVLGCLVFKSGAHLQSVDISCLLTTKAPFPTGILPFKVPPALSYGGHPPLILLADLADRGVERLSGCVSSHPLHPFTMTSAGWEAGWRSSAYGVDGRTRQRSPRPLREVRAQFPFPTHCKFSCANGCDSKTYRSFNKSRNRSFSLPSQSTPASSASCWHRGHDHLRRDAQSHIPLSTLAIKASLSPTMPPPIPPPTDAGLSCSTPNTNFCAMTILSCHAG
ncbi:hypothetical protein QBC40DRAFT_291509 [Triangularia verruculosa]|uniref:Uncharacterized protein n=1 Tax=Triangularia verruculosa TaxID=2587418 RepID=A0AAN6X5Z2_9PEZI|nr:hypothetical protein QBC40DRAFT_291509 [Triangularia verruculosa]